MRRYTESELQRFESDRLCEIVAALQDELDSAREQADSVKSYARDRALAFATREGNRIPIKSDGQVDMDAILKDATAYFNFLVGWDVAP